MAIAVQPNVEVLKPHCITFDDRHGWGFALLLTTTATLFVRPADLIPRLEDWPIYQFMIIACLVVSARSIVRQFSQRQLARQPATICLFLLLLAIGMSHLSHGFVWGARMSMFEYCKVLAFYLLITGLINTPQRLFLFVKLLALAITVVATLAVLDRADVISVAALESVNDRSIGDTGSRIWINRIRGTGIFRDPNDFGLILVTGLILSTSFLSRARVGWPRHLWLVPTCLLLVVLAMTHSRCALISLACAIPAAVAYRWGTGIGLMSVIGLPVLSLLFSGRMTDLNAVEDGTGQTRIQIWSDSLVVFRHNFFFGVGEGKLVDELGVVAHNSFIHCFAELGVVGGIAFVACFLATGLGLWELRDSPRKRPNRDQWPVELRELAHMRVFVFAALAAYAGGLLALSRQFVPPTYLVLGLATAAHSMHRRTESKWKSDHRFALVALVVSAGTLILFYLAVRILVRW